MSSRQFRVSVPGQGGEGVEQSQYRGPERRRYSRVVLQGIPVHYYVENGSSGWVQAVNGNAGEGGILLLTNELLPEETILHLRFALPGGESFVIAGRVVWNRKVEHRTDVRCRQGIEFIKVTDRCGEQFRKFLEAAQDLVGSSR